MTMSMYQASTPVFLRQLHALSAILGMGAAHAAAKGIDPAELIGARLTADMFPLARQVQIAADSAKGCVARLSGVTAPSYPDEETTFEALQQRIADTIAFIESVPADKIDRTETFEFVLKMRGTDMPFVGQPFLLHFALPNFFFHVTTAYAILRMKGVELGKRDFLGGI